MPPAIITYLTANYPNVSIDDAEKYKVDGKITYIIELENQEETELAFDAQGDFLGSNEEKEINVNELPDLALSNLNNAFSGVNISEIETELSWTGQTNYEVELENGIDVILDEKGNMVCEED